MSNERALGTTAPCSIDTRCEEEVLDDWNDFNLAQIQEQLIELFLACAVQDQVGTEYKDSGCQDWQDIQTLIAQDAIQQQEDLINLKHSNEAEEDPREDSLERIDAKLVHVVAHFRLIHLK